MENYKLPNAEEVVVDATTSEIVDETELSPIEKMKVAAAEFNIKLKDPEENCKKCHGRGYISIRTSDGNPIPCRCVFDEKDATPQNHFMMRPNRASKRRDEKTKTSQRKFMKKWEMRTDPERVEQRKAKRKAKNKIAKKSRMKNRK